MNLEQEDSKRIIEDQSSSGVESNSVDLKLEQTEELIALAIRLAKDPDFIQNNQKERALPGEKLTVEEVLKKSEPKPTS